MMLRIVWIFMFSIIIIGCSSRKQLTATADKMEKIHAIVKMDTINIISNWANPLNSNMIANTGLLPVGSTAGNISLIGNANYFKIIGDSVSIYLPYYGEWRFAPPYGARETGISFDGKPKEYKQTFNKKKNKYEYYFELKNNAEIFQINLTLFPNLNTDIHVNSNLRAYIGYRGEVIEK
ncbi:DUF4251 domain-containing protein [Seonamhaeicola sediminis]|uniref:DUF4251 domain-containing protein n=1 Tax=Seonamhaeicola sediminis TaxID=2528206 RepID=A0A562YEC1_9FLAO|nr:DUF4251 domain-containing protein [Seonamhaeicola sediminis]TWO33001.1 DUF4251 domain-containing protein [Seonamhaeicola sediminis]